MAMQIEYTLVEKLQAEINELRNQLSAAHAETTRVLSDLIACQDQRAALRAKVALLEARGNATLETDAYSGNELDEKYLTSFGGDLVDE